MGGWNDKKKEKAKELYRAQRNHELNTFPFFIINQLRDRLSLAACPTLLFQGEANRRGRFILFLSLDKGLTVPQQQSALTTPEGGEEDRWILEL